MSLELYRLRSEILLNHERNLEGYCMLKFTQVESRNLANLLKTVNERVSVYKKLSRRLGNVEVVL